ncbi:MAG TPA: S8 family serine peptidase, partial [Burkholderiales bacterium]|nr:S8 family serine peptidase [Burkholderiales bacterium]
LTVDLSAAQAAVDAAKALLVAAKDTAKTAQENVQAAELALQRAQVTLTSAQRALAKATIATKPIAQANVYVAQAAVKAAQDALNAAHTYATVAQAKALDAQEDFAQAREALTTAKSTWAAREREGQAARDLKRKFFATMPMSGTQYLTDAQLDSNDDYQQVNAFGSSVTSGGANIGVGLIDSGIEPGVDFADRITAFYDFTQGDIRAVAPNDGFGHGTHVAGLIASQFVGVAPNARLIGLKVLNATGQGTTENVVRAIEFAIANRAQLGISVLNLSLGHPIFEPAATDPLVQAVEHASRMGLTVVVSVGNFGMNPKNGHSGYAGIASPANAPSALSVGATRTFNTVTRVDDRVAPYSSRSLTSCRRCKVPNRCMHIK